MRVFLALVILAALAMPVRAFHCVGATTSDPEVDTCAVDAAGCFYFEYDPCQPGFCGTFWIYEESNGIPGLQRADEVSDDTCHGSIPGDTIIF